MPPCAISKAPETRKRVGGAFAIGAEQFDLQAFGRKGRAIDHDERPVGPLRALVDEPRHRFLAGAGGPVISTRLPVGATRSSWVRTLARAALDEPTNVTSPPARRRRLAFSRRSRSASIGAIDHQQQAVGLEGLLDEIVGAGLDRRHGGVDGAVAADHHHRHRRILAPDHLEKLQAVELAALQPDVEDHQRRPALAHRIDGLGAVVGAAGRMALILQDARDQRADVAFVVDDENIVAHDSSNCPRCCVRIIVRPSRAIEPTRFPSRHVGIPD